MADGGKYSSMCVAEQLDDMDLSIKLYAMVTCNRKYRYVIGRANLRFGDLLLACDRCFRDRGLKEEERVTRPADNEKRAE